MIRKSLFDVPLWIGKLNLNNDLLKFILQECIKNNYIHYEKSSREGSLQTYNLLAVKGFKYTKRQIENKFFQETNHKVAMNAAWICKNPKGSFNAMHIHAECHISGVYYLQHNDNGNIIFDNPNPVVQSYYLFDKDKHFIHRFTQPVEEGMIIFFPASVPHLTETNTKETDRLALSFNLSYIR